MLLVRTNNEIDFKGRPEHSIKLIARADNKADLVKAMNEDVVRWMAAELVDRRLYVLESDGTPPTEEGWEDKQIAELLAGNTPEKIYEDWRSIGNCREQVAHEYEGRKFVVQLDCGEYVTTVYHFLKDEDLTPITE